MLKLNQKLSSKQFILSQIAILIISLSLLFGLHYILNIQYQETNKPFEQGPVTSPPKSLRLDLNQPDDDTLTFQSSILISGETGPNMTVLIYSDTKDVVVKSDSKGQFSTILNLEEGINRFTAVVFDATGDTRMAERMVFYSKEKL